jgi:hypothetical protein
MELVMGLIGTGLVLLLFFGVLVGVLFLTTDAPTVEKRAARTRDNVRRFR